VRSFVEKAFREVGVEIAWRGEGVNEKGVDGVTGKTLIEIDLRYFRPTEVDKLLGDPRKAWEKLGWRHETSLDQLVAEMVREDVRIASQTPKASNAQKHGYD
jgi:GDPmannose 4,6-dehydratase